MKIEKFLNSTYEYHNFVGIVICVVYKIAKNLLEVKY